MEVQNQLAIFVYVLIEVIFFLSCKYESHCVIEYNVTIEYERSVFIEAAK